MAGSSSIELSQEKSVTPAGQEKKHEMQLEKKTNKHGIILLWTLSYS